jgi:hypothetical protein
LDAGLGCLMPRGRAADWSSHIHHTSHAQHSHTNKSQKPKAKAKAKAQKHRAVPLRTCFCFYFLDIPLFPTACCVLVAADITWSTAAAAAAATNAAAAAELLVLVPCLLSQLSQPLPSPSTSVAKQSPCLLLNLRCYQLQPCPIVLGVTALAQLEM